MSKKKKGTQTVELPEPDLVIQDPKEFYQNPKDQAMITSLLERNSLLDTACRVSDEACEELDQRLAVALQELEDCYEQISSLEAEVMAKWDWQSPAQVISLLEAVHKRYDEES